MAKPMLAETVLAWKVPQMTQHDKWRTSQSVLTIHTCAHMPCVCACCIIQHACVVSVGAVWHTYTQTCRRRADCALNNSSRSADDAWLHRCTCNVSGSPCARLQPLWRSDKIHNALRLRLSYIGNKDRPSSQQSSAVSSWFAHHMTMMWFNMPHRNLTQQV